MRSGGDRASGHGAINEILEVMASDTVVLSVESVEKSEVRHQTLDFGF